MSFAVGEYNPSAVYAAALMTCCVTIGLTIYAWRTKTDMTMYGGALWIVAFSLLGFGLCAGFTGNRILYDFYNLMGVIVYGFYLIYDTQLLIGSKKFKYNSDDYIIVAI